MEGRYAGRVGRYEVWRYPSYADVRHWATIPLEVAVINERPDPSRSGDCTRQLHSQTLPQGALSSLS